jgi:hypothetical protein
MKFGKHPFGLSQTGLMVKPLASLTETSYRATAVISQEVLFFFFFFGGVGDQIQSLVHVVTALYPFFAELGAELRTLRLLSGALPLEPHPPASCFGFLKESLIL